MNQKERILLLGNCGFERLADQLRIHFDVTVAGLLDTQLISKIDPVLVYVDLFDWTVMTPLYSMAIRDKEYALPIAYLDGIIQSLKQAPVWYRGIRKPSGGAFGIWQKNKNVDVQISRLQSLLVDERVIDIQALWSKKGIVLDDVEYGLGHGEASLTNGIEQAARVEADAILAILSSRSSIKCIVVDLDDTLIHGQIVSDDFETRNPAYAQGGDIEMAWWMLNRGLHEALQIAKQRGMILALASRNEESLVRSRFVRRKDLGDCAASIALSNIALDIHDFQLVSIGYHDKSTSIRNIAQELGIGLDSIAFLDNSSFERQEVSQSLPMVHVLEGEVADFRQEILCGNRFQPWYNTISSRLRAQSYRSRTIVQTQSPDHIQDFLQGMNIEIQVRKAQETEQERVLSLLQRTHQLVLTREKTIPTQCDIWIAHVQDRIADHGIVSAGIFVKGERGMKVHSWVCSCRVLPHRVAASILYAMCAQYQEVILHRDDLPRNGATNGLIDEAQNGIASWVQIKLSLPYKPNIHH